MSVHLVSDTDIGWVVMGGGVKMLIARGCAKGSLLHYFNACSGRAGVGDDPSLKARWRRYWSGRRPYQLRQLKHRRQLDQSGGRQGDHLGGQAHL